MHSVLRGAGVPLGKDRSEIRISLSDTVHSIALRNTFWKAAGQEQQ